MVNFVRPKYLGNLHSFRSFFIFPINDGSYHDSKPHEKKHALKKLRVLSNLMQPFLSRKDQTILHKSLPTKVEYVITCSLTKLQNDMYKVSYFYYFLFSTFYFLFYNFYFYYYRYYSVLFDSKYNVI
jgi:SNF2 family DNA or RNA helicase